MDGMCCEDDSEEEKQRVHLINSRDTRVCKRENSKLKKVRKMTEKSRSQKPSKKTV